MVLLLWWLEKQALVHGQKCKKENGRKKIIKKFTHYKGVCRVLENDHGSARVLCHLGKSSYIEDERGCGCKNEFPCRLRVNSSHRQ